MKPSTSKRGNNTSQDSSVKKYIGVQPTAFVGTWRSYVGFENRWISLGTYDSREAAAHARDAATVFIRGSRPEVLRKLNFPNSLPDVPSSVGQPFTEEKLKEIAREYANRVCTEAVQPALGTGEQSHETEVEEENEKDDPIDKEIAREYANRAHTEPVQPALGTGEQSNEVEVQEENENNDPIEKEITREYANQAHTESVQPALGGEQSNETEVEEKNGNDDPIDWSFMDENRNDSYVDWSLVDACASPVLPRQAGLDFSGYDFLPLSDSVPDHQVLDNAEEEEIRLWNFSD